MRRRARGLSSVVLGGLVAGCFAEVGADRTAADPDAAAADAGRPDAPPVARDNPCGVAEDQGDVGSLAAEGDVDGQGGQSGDRIYKLGAPVPATAADPRPDVIYVELWDDYGVFEDGEARPGTFTIAGAETDYQTCGVCVFTLADVDVASGPTRALLATAGTIRVLAVGDGELAVDVTGATFQEIDAESFEPVPGSDCPSPLAHAGLAATL